MEDKSWGIHPTTERQITGEGHNHPVNIHHNRPEEEILQIATAY
jgi:hypothetical protein